MGFNGFTNSPVGAQGTLTRSQIKSPNFVPGTSGWIIRKDGSVEFNNAVLRASLTLGSPTGQQLHLTTTTGGPSNGAGLVEFVDNANPNEATPAVIQGDGLDLEIIGAQQTGFLARNPSIILDSTGGSEQIEMAAGSNGSVFVAREGGVFMSNYTFKTVSITPVANTPTSVSVSGFFFVTGTVFRGFTQAMTTVVGSQVQGTSITSVTATSALVWIFRTNTTGTTVWYMVVGQDT